MSLAAITRDRISVGFFGPGLRRAMGNYCQLLAGTVSRVGLQAVYFFVLANTLSLSAMGIFASALAAGLMIASFSGLGFGSLAFRAAAGRPRLLPQIVGQLQGLVPPKQRVAPEKAGEDAGNGTRLAGHPLTPLQEGPYASFGQFGLADCAGPSHICRDRCGQRHGYRQMGRFS